MGYRKTAMALALDLREKRMAAGLTSEQMADALDFRDAKHVLAIESRRRTLQMVPAARAAYRVGSVMVGVAGVGVVIVLPVRASCSRESGCLTPGEAAWAAYKECSEAVRYAAEVQDGVGRRDYAYLARLYCECVLEPIRAAEALGAALERFDASIRAVAVDMDARRRAGEPPTAA